MILAVIGALVVVVALAGGPVLQRNQRAGEMRALAAALGQARAMADSCKRALAMEEEEFHRFDRRVDSLRAALEGYEDPDQGGVPQAEYGEYLETFEAYNSLVEDWQVQADSLQANEARCRALVTAHNELGDSIRTLQEKWRSNQD